MASLSHNAKSKRWLIQFKAPDGSRKTLSTPATTGRDKGRSKATAFLNHVQDLVESRKTGASFSPVLVNWLTKLPDDTHSKLVKAGLVEARKSAQENILGPYLESWFADRADAKKSTRLVWGNARRNLLKFFGAEKQLCDITEADSERFERWLRTNQKLSDSTVRKRCGFAKQMLQTAVKDRLIERNPLQGLKVAAVGNKKRQYFVTQAEAQKVLDACPNAEWRACFALARYGALRIPSEIQDLKWEDIDWANNRFRVHATKTEHHDGDGDRVVPLFPEVQDALECLWDAATEGAIYVLPNIRLLTNVNPQLGRIIENAGLKVWPKRWQNLRATRATELEREFPSHVVTGWCGHTERIAEQHYWMTTEDDFEKASTMRAANALQKGAETERSEGNAEVRAHEKSPVIPGSSRQVASVRRTKVEGRGHQLNFFSENRGKWNPIRNIS